MKKLAGRDFEDLLQVSFQLIIRIINSNLRLVVFYTSFRTPSARAAQRDYFGSSLHPLYLACSRETPSAYIINSPGIEGDYKGFGTAASVLGQENVFSL
jgi:hypothetical protein